MKRAAHGRSGEGQVYELSFRDTFSAAHRLRDYKGKCENPHGHNWDVEAILASQELDNLGMVVDFGDARGILAEILEEFDHKDLNALPVFEAQNPTTENMAREIYQRLRRRLPKKIRLVKVTVWESKDSSASYHEHDNHGENP